MEESSQPTAWAVLCPEHGRVFLTEAEYTRQLHRPDASWKCPRYVFSAEDVRNGTIGPCGAPSSFDDLTYEEWYEPPEMGRS